MLSRIHAEIPSMMNYELERQYDKLANKLFSATLPARRREAIFWMQKAISAGLSEKDENESKKMIEKLLELEAQEKERQQTQQQDSQAQVDRAGMTQRRPSF